MSSFYNNVIYCDAVGILHTNGLRIVGINFYPAAVSDVLDLNFWDESAPITATRLTMTATASSGTVTDDDVDHNVLTTAFADGAVVKVLSSNGAAANKTYHLIGTAGNNDRFIVTPTASWANETSKYYEIVAYPARHFYNALQPTVATSHESKYVYLGGVSVPNLYCETLSSNAYAEIYVL